MYAQLRFSNLTAFMTYVSVLTAASALLYVNSSKIESYGWLTLCVAALGLVVSGLFLALEVRHHHWWKYYEMQVVPRFEKTIGHSQYPAFIDVDKRDFVGGRLLGISATNATYGIYIASMIFFAMIGVLAIVEIR